MFSRLLLWWRNRDSLKLFGAARSARWPDVRAAHLRLFPVCRICGVRKNLAVHHKKPFHLFPALELEPSNLVTLCESAGMNCHITFGHLGNWQSFNEDVEEDSALWHEKITNRPHANGATNTVPRLREE